MTVGKKKRSNKECEGGLVGGQQSSALDSHAHYRVIQSNLKDMNESNHIMEVTNHYWTKILTLALGWHLEDESIKQPLQVLKTKDQIWS